MAKPEIPQAEVVQVKHDPSLEQGSGEKSSPFLKETGITLPSQFLEVA